MNGHDDRAWSDLLGDVASEITRQADERSPAPDFGEVLARARRLDPDAAGLDDVVVEPASELDTACSPARIGEVGSRPTVLRAIGANENELARSNDGSFDERVDHDTTANADVVVPLAANRRRAVRLALWTAGALAAAWLLVIELPASLSHRDANDVSGNLSFHQRSDDPELWSASSPRPNRRASVASGSHDSANASPDDILAPDSAEIVASDDARPPVVPATEQATSSDVEAERSRSRAARRSHRSRSRSASGPATLDDRLRELDAEAQRQWKAGDRQQAEALFREIISQGPKTRWAQLAYGDLFTIRRQVGDVAGETRLWERYLDRFPRGIHADEARAGLCRRASQAAASRCWRDYMHDFPNGSFRGHAEEAQRP